MPVNDEVGGAAIAALAIGFTWQVREAILTHVAAWWAVSDELTHADAIAVLGGPPARPPDVARG
jgi:hypothetical protein